MQLGGGSELLSEITDGASSGTFTPRNLDPGSPWKPMSRTDSDTSLTTQTSAPRTTLGMMMVQETVGHVVRGGPAYLAGLRKDDKIVQVARPAPPPAAPPPRLRAQRA